MLDFINQKTLNNYFAQVSKSFTEKNYFLHEMKFNIRKK